MGDQVGDQFFSERCILDAREKEHHRDDKIGFVGDGDVRVAVEGVSEYRRAGARGAEDDKHSGFFQVSDQVWKLIDGSYPVERCFVKGFFNRVFMLPGIRVRDVYSLCANGDDRKDI